MERYGLYEKYKEFLSSTCLPTLNNESNLKLNGYFTFIMSDKDKKHLKMWEEALKEADFRNIDIGEKEFENYRKKLLDFIDLDIKLNELGLDVIRKIITNNDINLMKKFGEISVEYAKNIKDGQGLDKSKQDYLKKLVKLNNEKSIVNGLRKKSKVEISEYEKQILKYMKKYLKNPYLSVLKNRRKIICNVKYEKIKGLNKYLKVEKGLNFFNTLEEVENIYKDYYKDYANQIKSIGSNIKTNERKKEKYNNDVLKN